MQEDQIAQEKGETDSKTKSGSADEQKRRSYYYDDAHGYEDFDSASESADDSDDDEDL